jgi:hypothetical protein
MMANPYSTFVEFFHQEVDPYAPRGAVLTNFDMGAGARTPAQLFADCSSMAYPLPLLMAGADGQPVIGIAPFIVNTLPGLNLAQTKYGFMGDMSPQGQLPGLVEITAECFHQTNVATVLQRADAMAAFQALAAGDTILPVPGAAAPVTAGARCKLCQSHAK